MHASTGSKTNRVREKKQMVPQHKCFSSCGTVPFFVDHFPFCCSSFFLFVGVEGGREGPYSGDREKSERLLFNTGSGARA